MKRHPRQFLVIVGVLGLFVLPLFVFAQQPPGLPEAGQVGVQGAAQLPEQAGLALPGTDIRIIVAKIIRVALGFLGIIAIVLIIYGGYLWMTSAGDEEKITKAKRVLVNATIGLAIILSAFAITQFILTRLLAGPSAPPLPPTGAPARVGGGALGSGIVESHYPTRGAAGVARNTRIIITFKEPIAPASLASTTATDAQGNPKFFDAFDDDGDGAIDRRVPVSGLTARTDAIQILKTVDIDGSVRDSDNDDYLGSERSGAQVLVSFTNDLRTFVLTPVSRENPSQRALFGSATENVSYTVYLCGGASSRGNCGDGIDLLSGIGAFTGAFRDYQWSFETGTFLDVTPPRVQSVLPLPDDARDVSTGLCPATDHGAPCDLPDRPRNSMVQVQFNEAILPTVASGVTQIARRPGDTGPLPTRGAEIQPGTFASMRVAELPGTILAGSWELGNQYRTAEFVTADLCGRNSCGDDVFCLSASSNVAVEVYAATLAQQGDPASAGLFDGIEDVAGNSLDGNRDGRAQGPAAFFDFNDAPGENSPGDNARFNFFTTDTILLGSPAIEATSPITTLGTSTSGAPLERPVEITFDRAMAMTTLRSSNFTFAGTDRVTGGQWDTWWTVEGENLPDDSAHPYGHSLGRLLHGGLWENTNYVSAASSAVRDLYQNCYYPGLGQGIVPGNLTCTPSPAQPYCCNGVACAPGDTNCQECKF